MSSATDTTTITLYTVYSKAAALESSLDAGWTIIAGVLVFFMQAGFTLLESGCTGSKNTLNIVMKNLIDICVGAVGWWALGYGLAFGASHESVPAPNGDSSGTMGEGPHLLMHRDMRTQLDGSFIYAFWFFQFTFCATAATIVSGALV